MKKNFIDAQDRHALNPDTFYAPSKKELDTIESGVNVKVCLDDERFWVEVSQVNGDEITGTVNNDLIHTASHGLKFGQEIKFEKRHVYMIYED